MKIIKILLLALLPFLFSCTTLEKCRTKYPCLTKDTISVIIKERDTAIVIEQDESILDLFVKCDSNLQVYIDSFYRLSGKRSDIKYVIRWKEGKQVIETACECDSVKIYLKLKDRYVTKVTNNTEVIPQKWYVNLKWLLILVLAIVLSLVAFRAIKKK